MKKKSFNNKLRLNKSTISNLNSYEMNNIIGATGQCQATNTDPTFCNPHDTEGTICCATIDCTSDRDCEASYPMNCPE